MFFRLTLLPVFLLLSCFAADKSALDKSLTSFVEAKNIPGVVAAIANRNGVTYSGASGFAPDTIFAIASMTKPITSVAVMQLVEAGKVKLDAPAATYCKELATLKVLENGTLREPKRAPTVRDLLTHTSGFGYEFMNRELSAFAKAGKVAPMMTGDGKYVHAPLVFDPGTRWEYGISTDWLGILVERVSGQSLDAYFKQHIFEPLDMNDTFFAVPAEKQSRVASVYNRTPDGDLKAGPARHAPPPKFLSGGGGLYSTAADYLTFARALLAGGALNGKRILKPDTVSQMGRNQIGELALTPMPSLLPQLIVDGARPPGELDKFGLGFALNTRPAASGRGAGTMSWSGVFNTFFWIDREKGICGVFMTQMLPAMDQRVLEALDRFEREAYRAR